jgi:plasmid stabilization system protein ParE
MKSFRLSADAAADVRDIRNYIAEDSIEATRRFIRRRCWRDAAFDRKVGAKSAS